MPLSKRGLLALLALAGVALILAATDFTAITWPWRHNWRVEYFHYSHESGWGYPYVSAYDPAQVACYLAAYGLAFVGLTLAARRYHVHLAIFPLLLCAAGAISFGLELTHWMWAHNHSFIASFPVLLLPLLAWVGLRVACSSQGDGEGHDRRPIATHAHGDLMPPSVH